MNISFTTNFASVSQEDYGNGFVAQIFVRDPDGYSVGIFCVLSKDHLTDEELNFFKDDPNTFQEIYYNKLAEESKMNEQVNRENDDQIENGNIDPKRGLGKSDIFSKAT